MTEAGTEAAVGTCFRCSQPPAGVVAVAELDDGLAAGPPLVEWALCAAHLALVAAALGFEGSGKRIKGKSGGLLNEGEA